MRHRFIKLLFLAGFLFSNCAIAASSCLDLMRERKKSFDHFSVYQNSYYKVEKILPGKHGGKLVMISRIDPDAEWGIIASENQGTAPMGNPLRFMMAMPQSISDFFGFKALDSEGNSIFKVKDQDPTYLIIPDVFEINGALKKLNKMLITNGYDGIPFRFFLDSGIISNENFLVQYLKESGFPYSSHNEISYHDLNYHLIPFLIFNQKMIDLSKLQTEVFLKFTDWLKAHHAEIASHELIENILYIRGSQLDLTGNIHLMMANPEFKTHHNTSKRAIKGFLGWGLSPFSYMADTFSGTREHIPKSILNRVTPEMIDEFKLTLSQKFFEVDPENEKFWVDIQAVQKNISGRLVEIQMALNGTPKKEIEETRKSRAR